jgi:hypothetical protein
MEFVPICDPLRITAKLTDVPEGRDGAGVAADAGSVAAALSAISMK